MEVRIKMPTRRRFLEAVGAAGAAGLAGCLGSATSTQTEDSDDGLYDDIESEVESRLDREIPLLEDLPDYDGEMETPEARVEVMGENVSVKLNSDIDLSAYDTSEHFNHEDLAEDQEFLPLVMQEAGDIAYDAFEGYLEGGEIDVDHGGTLEEITVWIEGSNGYSAFAGYETEGINFDDLSVSDGEGTTYSWG